MKTQEQISAEVKKYTAFEGLMQKQLDTWYASRGFTVDRTIACKQYDCLVGRFRVEEKIREGVKHDVLIEIIQDLPSKNLGWFYTCDCDYLHYVFTSENRLIKILSFRFIEFKSWLLSIYWTGKLFGEYQISTKGFGLTLNLVIPISHIPPTLLSNHTIGVEVGRLL